MSQRNESPPPTASANGDCSESSKIKKINKFMLHRYSELISEDYTKIHKEEQQSKEVQTSKNDSCKRPKRKVINFYNKQQNLLKSFMDAENAAKCGKDFDIDATNTYIDMAWSNLLNTEDGVVVGNHNVILNKRSKTAAIVSFVANIILLVAKIIAASFSDSIAVITTVVDSSIDVLSSVVTYFVNKKMLKYNIYTHPQGRSKLEPIGVLVISCVMAVASFQIIIEAISRVTKKINLVPEFSLKVILIIGVTIMVKICLYIYCKRIKTASVKALTQDHFNDVLTNMFVIIGMALTRYAWIYSDAVCSILLSIYIIYNWYKTGKANITCLVGRAATPDMIQRLTWICLKHHSQIVAIDTVRAYTFGSGFLVEVDVVLDENMKLKLAHNIGESLQQKLEALPEVERAFVHLDYEYDHDPYTEHIN